MAKLITNIQITHIVSFNYWHTLRDYSYCSLQYSLQSAVPAMARGHSDSPSKRRDDESEFFHETESGSVSESADDPYDIPFEDKYASPPTDSNQAYDTDTQFSKFVEDKWVGDDSLEEQGDDFDNIDERELLSKKKNENANKNKQNNQQQIKTKNDLTLELGTAGICGLLFVRNFVEGGMVGMVFGGIKGVVHGFQTGANKTPGFRRAVFAEAAANGRSLGLWLGTYRASKVLFIRTRGIDDLFNTFGAGFCAGSLYMLHTRSPVQIVTSGLSSGFILTALASFGGSSL